MKLTGADCPILFNRWQPIEFNDFILDGSGRKYPEAGTHIISQNYIFPFASLDINFDYIYETRQEIAASQIFHGEYHKDISNLFNKDILELYVDAKEFTQKHIDIASKIIPELRGLDVNRYSRFQRSISFEYTADVDFENVDLRNRVAMDIYLSLKDHLVNIFSKDKEFSYHGKILGFPIGNDEAILLKNGININGSGMPDKINAGTIYLSIYCDEKGSQDEFQKVFDEATGFIDSTHKDKLRVFSSGSNLNFSLKGQGSYWNIALPEIRYSKRLQGNKQELIQLPVSFNHP